MQPSRRFRRMNPLLMTLRTTSARLPYNKLHRFYIRPDLFILHRWKDVFCVRSWRLTVSLLRVLSWEKNFRIIWRFQFCISLRILFGIVEVCFGWLREGCYTSWKIDSTCYNEEFEENCYMIGDFALSLSRRVIFIEMNGGTDESYTGPNNM